MNTSHQRKISLLTFIIVSNAISGTAVAGGSNNPYSAHWRLGGGAGTPNYVSRESKSALGTGAGYTATAIGMAAIPTSSILGVLATQGVLSAPAAVTVASAAAIGAGVATFGAAAAPFVIGAGSYLWWKKYKPHLMGLSSEEKKIATDYYATTIRGKTVWNERTGKPIQPTLSQYLDMTLTARLDSICQGLKNEKGEFYQQYDELKTVKENRTRNWTSLFSSNAVLKAKSGVLDHNNRSVKDDYKTVPGYEHTLIRDLQCRMNPISSTNPSWLIPAYQENQSGQFGRNDYGSYAGYSGFAKGNTESSYSFASSSSLPNPFSSSNSARTN